MGICKYILRYLLSVMCVVAIASTFTMCENDCDCTSPPSADPPPYTNEDGEDAYPGDDKKDIPIKRPPTREELKKIRPRVRLIVEYKISRPSTCALGNSYDEAEWLDERGGDNGED